MYVNFKGTISGLQNLDVVTKIKCVMMSSKDATEAAAITAGRGVELTSANDLASFQSTDGIWIKFNSSVMNNHSYDSFVVFTPKCCVTESRNGLVTFEGEWTSGTTIDVYGSPGTPTGITANYTSKLISWTNPAATGNIDCTRIFYTVNGTEPAITTSKSFNSVLAQTFTHAEMTSNHRYKLQSLVRYGQIGALSATITPTA